MSPEPSTWVLGQRPLGRSTNRALGPGLPEGRDLHRQPLDVDPRIPAPVVAALFNPLRRKLQVVIESRFNRNRYDAAITIEVFSKTLSGSVDLAPLEGELSRLVGQTMQPRLVAVWLREET